MKDFRKLFRFVIIYKRYAFGNILFNLLGIVFGIVSLTLLAPFLNLLFDKNNEVNALPAWQPSLNYVVNAFKYYLTQVKHEQGTQGAVIFIGLFIITGVLLKNLFIYLALYVITPLRKNIIRDLRNQIYTKILRLPVSYFNNEKKGDLLSRFSNDLSQIEWSVLMALESVFKEPVSIISTIVCLVFISPKLTLIVVLLLPVSGLVIAGIGMVLRREAKVIQVRMGQILSMLEETISGMRIVKAFNNESAMRARFMQQNQEVTRLAIANNRRHDASSPASEVLGVFTVLVLLWVGTGMVVRGDSSLDASTFIIYLLLFTQVISPAKALSNAYNMVKRGAASLERVEEILNAPETIINAPEAKQMDGFHHSIEFRNVWFRYDQEYVLKNINLKIEKGKTVALVGPSGSGKSTLADLIIRFYDVQEGEILIDGINIKQYDLGSLRKHMGLVTQESILFNDTIRNNITFGMPDKTEEQITDAAHVANAWDFIEQSNEGLDTNIGERGSKLSGGQRQRVSIARAVLKNPDILILDEATSALDTTSERLVQDALDHLMQHRTSIVIAHRLSTIQHADMLVVLSHGEVIQTGTHDELVRQEGVYRELYLMQDY